VQRLDFLLSEVNYLMGVLRFSHIDKRYALVVQNHLERLIEISEKQGLLMIDEGDEQLQQSQDSPIVIQNQKQELK